MNTSEQILRSKIEELLQGTGYELITLAIRPGDNILVEVDKLEGMDEELQRLGVTPQYTYLFMKGHHIKENVVMKLVNPVCVQLRREREDQIRRLAQHRKQYENELSGYNNSASPVEVIMRKNDNYKDLFLYEWIREDIRQFLMESEKR